MWHLENDEARMVRAGLALNDEGMPKRVEFKASRLGFVSSFVILDFVIGGGCCGLPETTSSEGGYNSLHKNLPPPPACVLIARKINFCGLRSGLDERANIFHGIETDIGNVPRAQPAKDCPALQRDWHFPQWRDRELRSRNRLDRKSTRLNSSH